MNRLPACFLDELRNQGVLVLRQFLPPSVVCNFEQALESTRSCLLSGLLSRDARFVAGVLPYPLESIYLQPELWEAAQDIFNRQRVCLYFSRLLLKDSAWSGKVELHQDLPYFSGCQTKVSVFVPLAPMRADDGGLCFVKGSHKHGKQERGTICEEAFPPMEHLRPDVKPGDVIFMDFLTWHYSGPCSSERPLMQITYEPADTHETKDTQV